MTSFKGYANDVENERVKVKSMWSFLENVFHVLNVLFLHTNNLLKSILKNEHIDSTFTLLFSRSLAYYDIIFIFKIISILWHHS